MFLGQSEAVENPCKDLLANPVQCFLEAFNATPPFLSSLVASVGGYTAAVALWLGVFYVALYAVYKVLQFAYRGVRYFFHQTKVGQRVASLVPFKSYMRKFCCKAQEVGEQVQPKKLINTQAVSELGSTLVSKVHVDSSKWFRSALKHNPFSKSVDSDHDASDKSPTKTPQRSTSRLSNLTPKLLSPRSIKHQSN